MSTSLEALIPFWKPVVGFLGGFAAAVAFVVTLRARVVSLERDREADRKAFTRELERLSVEISTIQQDIKTLLARGT